MHMEIRVEELRPIINDFDAVDVTAIPPIVKRNLTETEAVFAPGSGSSGSPFFGGAGGIAAAEPPRTGTN